MAGLAVRVNSRMCSVWQGWLCKLLSTLANYTQLSNTAWMFVEGLFLHNRIAVSVFNSNPPLKLYYCIGWGMYAFI